MAVFTYKALDQKGRPVKGLVDAENVRLARQKLKQQGIFPTAVDETKQNQAIKAGANGGLVTLAAGLGGKRVSIDDVSIATRQLATLVGAGMPLVEALRALGEQIDNSTLRGIIAEVGDQVNEGATMAEALKEHPRAFPRLYVNMIAAGEASGSLDVVLSRLADLLESQSVLRRKVRAALTYPTLMMALCIIVVVVILTYVVPQVAEIFKDRNQILPLPTRIIMGLSNFLQTYWWLILAGLAAAFFAFRHYKNTTEGRRKIDGLALRLPLFGNLTLKTASNRFAKNLGMMVTSGVELLGALGIAKNIVGNVVLEKAIEDAASGVSEGNSLAAELGKSGLFPRLLIHMVATGEKTGQLESLLLRAADAFESEVTATISSLTSILEPLLILFLAAVVGCILAAVMLPMLEMSSLSGMQ